MSANDDYKHCNAENMDLPAYVNAQCSLDKELPDDAISTNESDDDQISDSEGILSEFKSRVVAILKGFGQPYDSRQEPTPQFSIYHPSFQIAESKCVELVGTAIDLLKNSTYQDKTVINLRERLERFRHIKYPEPRKVGIVGDSGVGKSSLINAILDKEGLAACVSLLPLVWIAALTKTGRAILAVLAPL